MAKYKKIECHPGYGWHAYQECFAQAITPYGFSSKPGGDFSNERLLATEAEILHFHWIERLWDTPSIIGKVKCLIGVYRYLVLAKKLNKKIVWTVHNHYPHENSSFADKLGLGLFAKFSDLIVTHSRWSKEWVCQHFPKAALPIVMPHGNFKQIFLPLDINKTIREELNLLETQFISGMIGVIRPNRGHELAIEAIKNLPDTQLLIAGRNNDKAYLEHLKAISSGYNNIVILEADLSNERYNQLVSVCDVVLLPYSNITTSGALLSSWTIGTPVITSNLPFFAEFCAQTNAGISLAHNTVSELEAAIENFMSFNRDSAHKDALNEADKYNWEQVVEPVAKKMLSWE